ncbi:MAG: dihydroneopterin aldolase [Candidatus Poseidoniales archaeon]|jgi:dihydroneopterin aldolase|tara:strand:- start:1189 stop:1551 length:363 start_codon:yes stop_codon:yes gene_type:complete
MTITVALENYTVMAKHGYYEFEHEQNQPFNFSVWATIIDHSIAGKLTNTLNYADIQIAIDAEIIDSKPIGLMETMSERIIKNLSTNEMVSKIKIRIEKPQAPLPHPGGLAVIEMQWVRPQ